METARKPRLMDRVRRVLRVGHYSIRTGKSDCYWIRYFIRHSGMRHPGDMGAAEVRSCLEYLAVERNVAAATQHQARDARVFLQHRVLDQAVGDIGAVAHAPAAATPSARCRA